jgi:hypothetical protein
MCYQLKYMVLLASEFALFLCQTKMLLANESL